MTINDFSTPPILDWLRVLIALSTLQLIAEALQVDIAEFVGNGRTIQETGLTNDEIHWLTVYRSLSDENKRLTTAIMSKLALSKSARYSTSTLKAGKQKSKVKLCPLRGYTVEAN